MQPAVNEPHDARLSGIVLIAATVLTLLGVAQHPHVTAPDIKTAMEQLTAMAGMAAWVHGILIALILVIFYALAGFALQRGIRKPLVLAGLVFYGAGTLVTLSAAAISGFVTGKIPMLAPTPTDVDLHVMAMLINYSFTLNQAFADIGTVAISAGILAWSVGLLHSAGWARIVGAIGILAGLAPALALMSGELHLNVPGLMLVVLIQAVWNIGIGVLLILRRV